MNSVNFNEITNQNIGFDDNSRSARLSGRPAEVGRTTRSRSASTRRYIAPKGVAPSERSSHHRRRSSDPDRRPPVTSFEEEIAYGSPPGRSRDGGAPASAGRGR
ncbi:hypothetical protein EVAR_11688_1 [Eumeta japonica]|uniref:Uncharacterized protein n=1 Tax=Eumeta variegata TaxID=151549 RepID=A0A4C1U4I1_EUMVA|nr:hypothetical protein EVAR_11688_1 [Eumeta japonica]